MEILIVIVCCIAIIGVLVCVRLAGITKGKELHQEYMAEKIKEKYRQVIDLSTKRILSQLYDENFNGAD